MIRSFNNWWKKWGQFWGFILLIFVLNGYWMIFQDNFQNDSRYPISWIVLFFGGAGWYIWQMRKHGWRLPKDIKETH